MTVRWGITGVACTTALAVALNFLALTRLALRRVTLDWGDVVGAHVPGLLAAALAVAGALPVALLLRRSGAGVVAVAIAGTIAGSVGPAALFLVSLRRGHADWVWAWQTLKQVAGKKKRKAEKRRRRRRPPTARPTTPRPTTGGSPAPARPARTVSADRRGRRAARDRGTRPARGTRPRRARAAPPPRPAARPRGVLRLDRPGARLLVRLAGQAALRRREQVLHLLVGAPPRSRMPARRRSAIPSSTVEPARGPARGRGARSRSAAARSPARRASRARVQRVSGRNRV